MAGKRTESDTDRKNAQEVMINVTIVEFAQIAGYGTKHDIFAGKRRHNILRKK